MSKPLTVAISAHEDRRYFPPALNEVLAARNVSQGVKIEEFGNRIIQQVYYALEQEGFIDRNIPTPQNLRPLGEGFRDMFLCLRGLKLFAESKNKTTSDGFAEIESLVDGQTEFLTLKELDVAANTAAQLVFNLFYPGYQVSDNLKDAHLVEKPHRYSDQQYVTPRQGLHAHTTSGFNDLYTSDFKSFRDCLGFGNILVFQLVSAAFAGDYQALKESPGEISLLTQQASFVTKYASDRAQSKWIKPATHMLESFIVGADDCLTVNRTDSNKMRIDVMPLGYQAGLVNALLSGRRYHLTEQERLMICVPGQGLIVPGGGCVMDGIADLTSWGVERALIVGENIQEDKEINKLKEDLAKIDLKDVNVDWAKNVIAEFVKFFAENFWQVVGGSVTMEDFPYDAETVLHANSDLQRMAFYNNILDALSERLEDHELNTHVYHLFHDRSTEAMREAFTGFYSGVKRDGLLHNVGDALAIVQLKTGIGAELQ